MAITHTLAGKHLIGGEWVAANTKTFRGVNPATGTALEPPYPMAGDAEMDAALRAASESFQASRNMPPTRWAELLEAIAQRIQDLGDVLLQTGNAETGLPLARMTGERTRTCSQLKMFADLVREGSWVDATIDTADAQRQPIPKPDVRRMLRPIGPVVVFGPSNFPFAFGVCGGDTASALAAGNPVVVKAHSNHPATSELFAAAALAALQDTRMPLGLVNVLYGSGHELGAALVKHPATAAVGFTGSERAGRSLFDLAAAREWPIPVYAEMGSLNPLVILPGAMVERSEKIATGLAQSVTMGVGQFCTKPAMALVLEDSPVDTLIGQLKQQLSAVAPAPMLAQEMQRTFCETTGRMANVRGVKVHLAAQPSAYASITPMLLEVAATTWRAEPWLQEEAFGPSVIVVRCKDLADVHATISATLGNLTGAIHTGASDNPDDVRRLVNALVDYAGRVIFDGFPTGVEVCAAMVHGGPYPATTFAGFTSVGASAVRRFARPVCYQNTPDQMLPVALQNANPIKLLRQVNGHWTRDSIGEGK